MLTSTLVAIQAASVIAAGGGGINTPGIQSWLLSNIVPLVLAGIGCLIIVGAHKGNLGKVFTTSTITIIGIMFIVGAGAFIAFGQDISGVIFKG